MPEQNAENQELTEQERRSAVLAEIMRAYAPPHIESAGVWSTTVVDVTQWGETIVLNIHQYGDRDNRVIATDTSTNEVQTIKFSHKALDRLCAAWIQWRTSNYESKEDDLGDLDSHPF